MNLANSLLYLSNEVRQLKLIERGVAVQVNVLETVREVEDCGAPHPLLPGDRTVGDLLATFILPHYIDCH